MLSLGSNEKHINQNSIFIWWWWWSWSWSWWWWCMSIKSWGAKKKTRRSLLTVEGGGGGRERRLKNNIINKKVFIFRIVLDKWWRNNKLVNSFRRKWVSMNRRTRTHITKSLFFNHQPRFNSSTLQLIKRVHGREKKGEWSESES